ncbi:MAG TPA: HepT-like ribonuclease domain-containing protein, partial [Phototrophicaceae bacterium]|nr:HepT-like ribonuclease domain-containing protein [Phototrophicaceae bacterium]
LDDDEILVFALIRALTIIGEAASNVTESFREAHPQISWALIIGMRHRVVQAYFEVDLDIVWDTVTKNLPTLLNQLDSLLPNDDEPE